MGKKKGNNKYLTIGGTLGGIALGAVATVAGSAIIRNHKNKCLTTDTLDDVKNASYDLSDDEPSSPEEAAEEAKMLSKAFSD